MKRLTFKQRNYEQTIDSVDAMLQEFKDMNLTGDEVFERIRLVDLPLPVLQYATIQIKQLWPDWVI